LRKPYIRKDVVKMKAKNLLKECKVRKPPVNLDFLAERLGIEVHYCDLPNIDFSLSVKAKGRYIIIVQLSGNYGRDRWSLAHELGHIVLNHYDLYNLDTIYVDRLNEEDRYILDREADIFAKELLMPGEWVLPKISASTDDLMDVFEVSRTAMEVRLNELCTSK